MSRMSTIDCLFCITRPYVIIWPHGLTDVRRTTPQSMPAFSRETLFVRFNIIICCRFPVGITCWTWLLNSTQWRWDLTWRRLANRANYDAAAVNGSGTRLSARSTRFEGGDAKRVRGVLRATKWEGREALSRILQRHKRLLLISLPPSTLLCCRDRRQLDVSKRHKGLTTALSFSALKVSVRVIIRRA